MGPSFTLTMWDTGRLSKRGSSVVGYRLTMIGQHQATWPLTSERTVLFEGEDYGPSPMHCVDSNAAVEDLMAFLTCKPGDTDSEYFASYKPHQLNYCRQHAEALRSEVDRRFCDENGRVLDGKR